MRKLLLVLLFIFGLLSLQGQNSSDFKKYITGRYTDPSGRLLVNIIVPGKPPDNFRMPVANTTRGSVIIADVPGYDWSFGCSPTSASMMAGYYDRTGRPNIYTGPTNGGVAPMDNSSWGSVVINGETRKQCPISATRNGVDGRSTRGHVDDYWVKVNSMDPDPYITNGWTQHSWDDCTADFMYSNQYSYQRCDGATGFIVDTTGLPIKVQADWNFPDGLYGLSQFFISRGYSVADYYTQFVYPYGSNTKGFSFTQFKQEINAGRPVLIQLLGHTMLGYGYDDASNTVYLHDTWDYAMHSMTWGGSYGGMQQWGVCMLQLSGAVNIPPTVTTTAVTCIGTTTATAGGIACDGGDTITVRGVCWSTSQLPTIADNKSNNGGGEGSFSSTLTGLTANTTYYFRAYATNTLGTEYGLQFTLTTLAAPVLPNVITTAISGINETSATGGGTVSCDGGATVSPKGVCWSLAHNPTIADAKTTDGSGMGIFTSNISGLTASTTYYVRAYATNSVGTVYGSEVSFTTLALNACNSFTVNHITGSVAPVNKTVTYGTVTGIPGETTKCWISSNLGADHQATAVNDATEASAGWYWQFNRKQGYKNDGTTRTPNTAWIYSISENLDWEAANDPCALELGCGWRIPTNTELTNIDASGNWSDWNGPWNSPLKFHAAGDLNMNNGTLFDRGVKGMYWSSIQTTAGNAGNLLWFTSTASYMTNYPKSGGFPLRCIKSTNGGTTAPTVTTSAASNIASTLATSGGNVTSDGGCNVLIRGVCWGTSPGPSISGNHTVNGNGTGVFISNLTGLSSNTLYYLKAYSGNSNGISYGNELSFVTTPSLTTATISSITTTASTCGGTIAIGGGSMVTSRGVCWSTASSPTIADSHTTDGGGTGAFVSNLTGLSGSTLYYVRAYAINTGGTSYGDQQSFTTANPIQMISPNGGEIWLSGTVHPITWNAGTVSNVKIEYSIDNGTNWTSVVASTPATPGSYSWTVPNPAPTALSTPCKVKVTSTINANAFDVSDAAFTILNALKHAPFTYTDTININDYTTVFVPVKADRFRKIRGLSLRLDYNPVALTYTGPANINTALAGLVVTNTSVSPTLSKVMINWSDPTPVTLAYGSKVLDIQFTHNTGETNLIWNNTDNSGQDCAYADSVGNPLTDIPTAFFYRNGLVYYAPGWQMSGTFTYNNTAATPLDSLWVVIKQNNIRIDSTRTALSGAYSFACKPNGIYTVSARTSKPWSSVNATDAIKVQRHFAGLEVLTEPVRLLAADVNLSNSINATDAIKIKRRFSGLDNSFDRGNWTFAKPGGGDTIIVNGAAVTQNFYGLCVGDVNGSNIPSTGKWISRNVEITNAGVIKVKPGQVFELPVKAGSDMTVSAISLVIPYPQDLIEVLDVQISQGEPVYNILPGQVRIAWSEINGLRLKEGETLLTLKLRAKEAFRDGQSIDLSPDFESELADDLGEVIQLAELTSLTIKPNSITDADLVSSCKVYPNPARDFVTLELQLNSAADCRIKLLDVMGREVTVIPEQHVEKGNARVTLQIKDLPEGLYTLKIAITAGGIQQDYLQKIIITR